MRCLQWFRGWFVTLVVALAITGCEGIPPNMVVVEVKGLSSRITELYVTLRLDDTVAKNSRPSVESGENGFIVYQQMERFGISVPANTQRLSVDVVGYDTARSIVGRGSGVADVGKNREITVELAQPSS